MSILGIIMASIPVILILVYLVVRFGSAAYFQSLKQHEERGKDN